MINTRSRVVLLGLLLTTAAASPAQETRQTVTNPSPDPRDDSKPNSPSVPGAYAVVGHFDRIVIIRVKPGEDLLAGMTKEVKELKIQNGVILSAIGSMRGFAVHQVTNRKLPTQNTIEKNPTQPVDLVSMNGYVINGRIHAHMTVATPDRVIGGHLETGTEVYTYGIVTIGVMNATNLDKIDDKGYR
jgi:predicted DNA-binding protein with PD1-like motif